MAMRNGRFVLVTLMGRHACRSRWTWHTHMPCLLGDFSRVSSHLGTPITANPNVLLSILCPVLIDNNQIAVEVTRKSCMSERLEIFIFYLLKERLEKAYIKMKRIINKLKKCERRSECGTLAVTEFPQTSLMNTRERERDGQCDPPHTHTSPMN